MLNSKKVRSFKTGPLLVLLKYLKIQMFPYFVLPTAAFRNFLSKLREVFDSPNHLACVRVLVVIP
jgi:hypothetical protein